MIFFSFWPVYQAKEWFSRSGSTLSFSWQWHNAKLLHHIHLVGFSPSFNNLAASYASDANPV
jgi:hypothetical protein